MIHILRSSGFRRSICDQSFYYGPVSKFWAYAFVLSKAPELGECLVFLTQKGVFKRSTPKTALMMGG